MSEVIVKLGDGNWATKEGKLLAHKQVGDRYLNTEFTVTRGTDATYMGRDGLIKQMSDTSTELVTDGGFPTGTTAWELDDGWSLGDGVANGNISGSLVFLYQNVGITLNKTYKANIEVKTLTSGSVNFYYHNGSSFINVASNLTLGPHTFYFTATGGTNGSIYIGTGSFVGSVTDISVKKITDAVSDVPRIDFLNNPQGHLLLEPQSTNFVLHSEDFSNGSSWAKTNSSIAGGFTSPAGTSTAYKITTSAPNGQVLLSTTALNGSDTRAISVFAKASTSTSKLQIIEQYYLGTKTTFDLNSGSIDAGGNTTSSSIENYGNGWYRCSVTQTFTAGQTSTAFAFRSATITSFYLWGGQAEGGSYATSYIPTNGVAITRATETCTGAGAAKDFNSVEGVLYSELAGLTDAFSSNEYITISDGTTNNRIAFYHSTTSGLIKGQITNASSAGALEDKDVDVRIFHKVAIHYKLNDFKFFVNGSQEGSTDTSVAAFDVNELNTLNFNLGNGSSTPFYGKIKSLQVYKNTLTDAELTALTTL